MATLRFAGLLGLIVWLAACGQSETNQSETNPSETNQPEAASVPAGVTECTTPRPEMCTREYRPVCAAIDTGVRCVTEPCPSMEYKTFGNGCDACSTEQVLYYSEGECPDNDG